jgi:hypothetical protein
MRGYVRSLGSARSRAYREFFDRTRRRTETPFEVAMRSRRIDQACELERLAEAALKELLRQKSIAASIFHPGDHVLVTNVMPGYEQPAQRYVISDVEPDRRDRYHYRAWTLTKAGEFHKRWDQTIICPSRYICIEMCDLPLSREVARRCDQYRRDEADRRNWTLETGDLVQLSKLYPNRPH